MKRTALIVTILFAMLAAAGVAWLAYTEEGLHTLVRWWLPDNIRAEGLHGRAIGPMRIESLSIELPDAKVRATQVELDWHPAALLAGTLHIATLRSGMLKVELRQTQPPSNGGALVLPLAIDIDTAKVRNISLRTGQEQWQVQRVAFSANTTAQHADIEHLEIETDDGWARGTGQLPFDASSPVKLSLDWQLTDPQWRGLGGHTQLGGSFAALDLQHESLEPLVFSARAHLEPLQEPPEWQLTLEVPAVTPASVNPHWPTERLAANLDLHGSGIHARCSGKIWFYERLTQPIAVQGEMQYSDERLIIDHLDLALDNSPAKLSVAGKINTAPTFAFALRGNWQALQWPATGTAQISSPVGEYAIAGNPDAYRGTLAGRVAGPLHSDRQVEGDVEGEFSGSTTRLEVTAMHLQSGDGTIAGTAHLDWQKDPILHAELNANRIDPALLVSRFEGAVNFALTADATLPAEEKPQNAPTWTLQLDHVSGVVNGRPLSGHARFHAAAGTTAGDLEVRLGLNAFTAKGTAARTLDVAWTLDARDLAGIVPEASGQLAGRGRISGSIANPRIVLATSGKALAWRNAHVSTLDTRIDIDLQTGVITGTHLEAQGLQWRDIELTTVTASAGGQVSAHAIEAELTAPDGRVSARAAGGYERQRWHGRLLAIDSSSPQLGRWQLDAPADIELTKQRLSLQRACLSDPPAHLCAAGHWSGQAGWALKAGLREVTLARFSPWLPDGFDYRGKITADIDARSTAGAPWRGTATASLMDASVTLSGEAQTLAEVRNAQLQLQADAHDFALTGTLAMAPEGRLDAQINAARAAPRKLTGRITGQLTELDLLAVLVPEIRAPKGHLALDLRIGGTADAPGYTGGIALIDGSARVTELGITLSDVALQLQGSARGLAAHGSARSGEGAVQLDGTLDWSGKKTQGQLTLIGQQFRAMDHLGTTIDASPDLALAIDGGKLILTGKVHVDKAHIAPVTVGRSRITTSPDEMIVGETPVESRRWRVTSRIAVTLGDITIDAYGLEGRVRGGLNIIDLPGQPARGNGELAVDDGFYNAWGQALSVERGRLIFGGGPVDNPGIDVRAVRHLETVTAGVDVRGTLKNPQLTVFSIPPRPRQYAMALLLIGEAPVELGRPSDTLGSGSAEQLERSMGVGGASGGGAPVALGTYLSPDFYVGYLESFSMRYRLSRRWTLELERGIDTSLGIVYSIR
ncbi:MAG: translocation/assembly module TamB domain-containing protein [Pseudomonadota bacterium]|nr:MAG: translocation/assembly module TamB domain-containing protein [Pseudomonadota bacterium]